MRRVSIATLKARLSEYLAAVKAGEEVIVTDRGRPVARLAPVNVPEQADARMQQLIRAGLVRPPIRKLPADFWERPRPADPEGRALAALLEERAEGR
jgi:prevent-host-death family protein